MKKFKKLVALVVVAMFLLSFVVAPAAAADTTTSTDTSSTTTTATDSSKVVIGKDVTGTKYEEPSKKLMALGVIKGFEDGTIRPESEVTRAQFATIVALELGLGDVSPSPTKFKDVPATHWASGAINLAVGKGIIVGYPDGTFKPDQPVSFAEASAMLMQMLGYAPAMAGGSWPATPLSLAATNGVSQGIHLGANDKTPRGEVIEMAVNALTAPIMEQDTWGTDTTYVRRNGVGDKKTILSEVWDIDVMDKEYNDNKTDWDDTMPTVSKTPRFDLAGLDSNKINFSGSIASGDFKVNSLFDPNQFMGQEAEVWVDRDDLKVYYIGPTDDQTVYYDTVDSFPTGQIKLDARDDEYDLTDSTNVYINTLGKTTWGALKALANFDDLKADLIDADVKVVLKDDNSTVDTMIFTDYYVTKSGNDNYSTLSGFVKDVNADDETLNYYDKGGDETSLDLDGDDYAVVKDGEQATLADLKADDVVNILYDGDQYYIIATSKKVSGTVEKTITASSDPLQISAYDVYVNGTKYDVTPECTYSDDNNDNINLITDDDLKDLGGKDVTLYLDAQDNIKHIVTKDATESSSLYACLTKTPEVGSFDEVKVTAVNKAGQKMTVTFDPGDVDVYGLTVHGVTYNGTDMPKDYWKDGLPVTQHNPIFFKYELDSAGNLSEVHAVPDVQNITQTGKIDAVNDHAINLTNGSFNITDKTVIWDATSWDGGEIDDMATVSWASLDDREVQGFAKTSGANVEYLVITNSDKSLGAGDNYGVVKGFGQKNGNDAVTILGADNQDHTYVWDSATMASTTNFVYDPATNGSADRNDNTSQIKKGDVVYYTLTGTGDNEEIDEIAVVAVPNMRTYDQTNTSASGEPADDIQVDSIKLVRVSTSSSTSIKGKAIDATAGTAAADDSYYTVNSDTKYYDIHDTGALKQIHSLSVGDLVVLVDTDDDSASYDYVVKVQEKFTPNPSV